MKTFAIIQARMGSTRLPGKVLMDLGGASVLSRVVRRTRRARLVDRVLVATTESAEDDAVVRECESIGAPCFRGSAEDVLDRYYKAAIKAGANTVVRITSDCPLIDPEIVDLSVKEYVAQKAEYLNNISPRRYPRGLDTEVFDIAALERTWREARQPHQREHVTPYLYEHPDIFRVRFSLGGYDYTRYRWTLDTQEDLELLRTIYQRFEGQDFSWKDVIALMEAEPELAEINAGVKRRGMHGGA